MKRRRYLTFVLLLFIPLALCAYIAWRNAWRTKTIILPGVEEGRSIGFSPNGRLLVIGTNLGVSLYDVRSRGLVFTIKNAYSPYFLRDNRLAAGVQGNEHWGHTEVYSVLDGKLLARTPQEFYPLGGLVDSNTVLLAADLNQRHWFQFFTWDYQAKHKPRHFSHRPELAASWKSWFGLLADKRTLEAEDDNMQFWDISQRKLLFTVPDYTKVLTSNANGLCAWWSHNNKRVEIWNYKTGHRQNSFSITSTLSPVPLDEFYVLALSPDGTLLACGNQESPLFGLWDTKTGLLTQKLNKSKSNIVDLSFSPNGRTVASIDSSGLVKLWRIK